MSGMQMNPERGYDQRLSDWLEDGVQSVPDWLVEAALEQAHATPQQRRGIRLPWLGQLRQPLEFDFGRLAPALIGALGAMVVVGAFVMGLLSAGCSPTVLPGGVRRLALASASSTTARFSPIVRTSSPSSRLA